MHGQRNIKLQTITIALFTVKQSEKILIRNLTVLFLSLTSECCIKHDCFTVKDGHLNVVGGH